MKKAKIYYRLIGIGLLISASDQYLKFFIETPELYFDPLKGFGVGIVLASFYKIVRLKREYI